MGMTLHISRNLKRFTTPLSALGGQPPCHPLGYPERCNHCCVNWRVHDSWGQVISMHKNKYLHIDPAVECKSQCGTSCQLHCDAQRPDQTREREQERVCDWQWLDRAEPSCSVPPSAVPGNLLRFSRPAFLRDKRQRAGSGFQQTRPLPCHSFGPSNSLQSFVLFLAILNSYVETLPSFYSHSLFSRFYWFFFSHILYSVTPFSRVLPYDTSTFTHDSIANSPGWTHPFYIASCLSECCGKFCFRLKTLYNLYKRIVTPRAVVAILNNEVPLTVWACDGWLVDNYSTLALGSIVLCFYVNVPSHR